MAARNMNEGLLGRPPEPYTTGRRGTSGQAVPIVFQKTDGGFELDKNALRRILQSNSDARDKPLAVVSVAGAFRKGKSFLLNFFLRYMRNKGQGDWLGGTEIPLEGFPWRHGSERDTTGIVVWSEVFLVTRPKGDQVAVLFMDTQGAFDSDTTLEDCATIFALSTLTSSVQVYNLSKNIHENDLQHLQFFTEYGRMAQQHKSREKPFQKLLFLVRDWAHIADAEYGGKGGRKILKRRLNTSWRKKEQKRLRDLIHTCFNEIDCFLLPYPGHQVATGQSENGYLPDMVDEFKHHLQLFVDSLLAGEKLVTKRINGQEISFKEWVTYFSKYASIFKEKKLPEIKSFIEVKADVNNIRTLNTAKKMYEDGMERICGANKPFKNIWDLRRHHKAQLKAALNFFASAPKLGGEALSQPYTAKLRKEIKDSYKRFVERNNQKRTDFAPLMLSVSAGTYVVGVMAATLMSGPAAAALAIPCLVGVSSSVVGLAVCKIDATNGPMHEARVCIDSIMEFCVHRLRRLFHITPAEDVSSNPQHDSHSLRDYRDATVEQVETAQPVQILRIMDHQRVELDEEELGRILLADHVKDKPVVVVSVAGAFRKGKSFLLDFFLRYVGSGCQDDWLDDPSIPLGGISWREVCERGTPSILIWDEVFLVKTSQGRQLAVLFMYTQGAFDGASTFKDCAKVLALSTMTSSVLVYNLSRNINDNDLQHLQPLNEYARLVQQDTGKEPFQNLQLLVRDWTNQPEAGYGAEGGWTILNRWLQSSGGQHKYLQQLRRHIWSCFEKIGCFLMPHPGYQVATTASFDGPFSDVHEDFKTQLRELVPSLLAPDNLLVKKINGREITCQELMTYFQVYVNIFKNYELPNPMTMLEAMAEATNVAAVATAKDEYISHMEQLCGEDQPYLCPELLERHHLRLRESAKKLFALRKMPGEQSSQQYMERLTKEIHETYKSFAERNERKKIVAALRTPATLFIVVLAFYLSSCTLCLLGLHSHANISNVLMALSLISLSLWGYVRFTGRMWEVGAHIDTIAAILWAILLKPVYKAVMQGRVPRPTHISATGRGTNAPRNNQLNVN